MNGLLYPALVALYIIALAINAGLIGWAWRQDFGQVGKIFIGSVVMLFGWTATSFAGFVSPSVAVELFMFHFKYVFQWGTAIGWFIFAMYYTGREGLLTRRAWFGIGAFYVLTNAFTMLNPWHNLIWTSFETVDATIQHSVAVHGPLFLAFTAVGYSFTLGAAVILITMMLRSGRIGRQQTAVLGLGFAAATAIHAAQSFHLFPVDGYDYVSLIGTMIGVIIGYALLRKDLLAIEPVSRTRVMESVQEGILVVTTDKRVADYNDVAVGIFPEVEGAIGAELADVAPELIKDDSGGFAGKIVVPDGTQSRTYVVDADPIRNHGSLRGHTVILRDITEVEAYAADLERQTEHLDEFASFVSHDLRNPLAVAKTYLYDVRGDVDDERIDVIEESLDRMNEMIDDALTLAREGRVIEEREWESLKDIADDAWAVSDTRDATFVNEIPAEASIYADDVRVQSMLENLYRNSVDHGSADVEVSVGLLDDRDGFYVEDNGPGIPEDERERVFEKGFTTAEDGTGIGLAIVNGIIKAHGWRIEVVDGRGGGVKWVISEVESLAFENFDERDGNPEPEDVGDGH